MAETVEIALALLVAAMMIVGSLFSLAAAIGLIRFPDLYTRMHAASKAGTVGSGLLLLAIGIHSGDLATFGRACAGIVFFILTAPVAAHLLARAAHKAGYPLSAVSVSDDMSK